MEYFFEDFKYCPKCGTEYKKEDIFLKGDTLFKCRKCFFDFYQNPKITVSVFVFNDQNNVLIAKRSINPMKGFLETPGGFVRCGETLEEGALREVKEETGLDIKINKILFSRQADYLYKKQLHPIIAVFLVAEAKNNNIKIDKTELLECEFRGIDELLGRKEEFAFEGDYEMLKFCKKHYLKE